MERFRIEIRHAVGVGKIDPGLAHMAVDLAEAQQRIVVTVIAEEENFHAAGRPGIHRGFTRRPNVCRAGDQ